MDEACLRSTPRDDRLMEPMIMKDLPMDDTADGRTTRIHWRTKQRYKVSCIFPTWFVLHVLIKMEYFSDEKFQSLGTARIHLDRWRHNRSTPMTDDPANGAHQVLSDGLCIIQYIQVSNNQWAGLWSFRKIRLKTHLKTRPRTYIMTTLRYILGCKPKLS